MALSEAKVHNPAFEGITVKDFWKEVCMDDGQSISRSQKPFDLITVREDDTVVTVLEVLCKFKITSTPVQSAETGKYIGIIDMLDLVTFCAAKFSVNYLTDVISRHQVDEFLYKTVAHVAEISGRNMWREVSYSQPLTKLAALLSHPHIHRVAVDDESDRVIGLATQSNLLKYLYDHQEEFFGKERLQQPLKEWTFRKVETIDQHQTTIEAFQRIWEKEVSGLAVVNSEGKLVANLSASDLKRISFHPQQQMARDLYTRLEEFLFLDEDLNKEKPNESGQTIISRERSKMIRAYKNEPIFLYHDDPSATLQVALRILSLPVPITTAGMDLVSSLSSQEAKTKHQTGISSPTSPSVDTGATTTRRIHRVFIVDAERKPIGIISVCDIIKKCLEIQ